MSLQTVPIYRIFAPLVIVCLTEMVIGCSTIDNLEIEHVVMFNKDGQPIDPTGNIGCKEETPLCNGSHFMFKEYPLSKPEYWDHCEGYPDLTFGWNDLIGPEGVATRLLRQNKVVLRSLWEKLSLKNQELLKAYEISQEFSHELEDALICDFDHIVRGDSIFDSHWFRSPHDPEDSRVLLTEDTWKLAESRPQGEMTIRRLNRLLLAELFPDEIRKRAYDVHLTRMFNALHEFGENLSSGPKKIFLFIHGGLNTAQGALKRAKELTKYLKAENQEEGNSRGYFPIFVNWDSSLVSSYLDHLLLIRQGRTAWDWCCDQIGFWLHRNHLPGSRRDLSLGIGLVTMPFYLVTDILRGLVRAPLVLLGNLYEIANEVAQSMIANEDSGSEGDHELTTRFGDRSQSLMEDQLFPFSKGESKRDDWEVFVDEVGLIVSLPAKLVSAVLLDMVGQGSWHVMRRRTNLLFHSDNEFQFKAAETPIEGGLFEFLLQLEEFVSQKENQDKWEITLVGHSMGTIIANEIIRRFGDSANTHELKLKRIVYMAAATTIKDYEDTVFPFLSASKNTQMYHLTLLDKADVREVNFWDIPLRGSLLIWIDEFLAKPETYQGRVVGRFKNLITSLHKTPKHLRDRISIKEFFWGKEAEKYNPQAHGDFNGFPFWKEDFWQPGRYNVPRLSDEQS